MARHLPPCPGAPKHVSGAPGGPVPLVATPLLSHVTNCAPLWSTSLATVLIQYGDSPDEDRLQITVNRTHNVSLLSVTEQLWHIPGVREISHTLS